MKKLIMIIAVAAFTTGIAQEGEKKVTTKVKTTVSDSMGEETSIKETTKTTKTDVALIDYDGQHDFNTVMLPSTVNTNVDYYNKGVTYRFAPSKTGFTIVETANSKITYARLYPSSQKGYYIYTQGDDRAFGYFNQDGDFVVESYDPDGDGVMNYVYKIKINDDMKKNKMMKNKNKMK